MLADFHFPYLSGVVGLCSDNTGTHPQEGLRERLLPDGRPIGQPLSSNRADVRIMRVDSRAEADSVFYGLCTGLLVTRMTYDGEIWMVCRMQPHYGGELYYMARSGYDICPLAGTQPMGGGKEIRFMETVKTRR